MGHNYEEKRRYKLYKAKKRWVSAAIITASGALLFLGAPSALADEAVTTEVTTTAENGQQTQPETQQSLQTPATEANTTEATQTPDNETPAPTTQADHEKGNVEGAWDQGYRGQGMVVAVIDSGADTTHKDFQQAPTDPKLSQADAQAKINELGYGSYASEKFPFVYNYASKSNDWIKDDGPGASQHGQHVAGIIGADGRPNGDEKYAVGVAPESQILALRVFNDQFADENTDDIAQAIYDAVNLGANVIQMSLGQGVAASDLNDVEQKAVQYAIDHGVFVSISASNNGHAGSIDAPDANYSPGGANGAFEPFSSSTVANPGASRNALTVAAANSGQGTDANMADFSSWGPMQDFTLKPDISAPGVQIVSTGNDDGYKTMSGTSMAGPFAAGSATIVMQKLQKETSLKNAELVQATKALLMNTSQPLLDAMSGVVVSPRRQGAGQINVGAAVASPVYITADDGTSSLSLRQIGTNTQFNLTFTNLSNVDQTYTFDDLGGGFTEKRDDFTGYYYEEQLTGARVNGANKVVVKAGQTVTVPYTLALDGVTPDQLVEGWLRFTGDSGQSTLVVPFLGYFGDMTSEEVLDKKANDATNVYGGNYFVNEHNYPRGIADEESLKKLVNLDGDYNWQQVAKLYQDGKVAFSPNNDNKSDLLKPVAFVKQNLQDLKVVVLDQNGKVVRVVADEKGLDKSFYQSDRNQDVSLSVSMRNDPNTFDWDGMVYNDKTGEFEVASDGQYTYRFVATLYNDGQKKVQTADYPIIIDTTAPTISNYKLTLNPATDKPSGHLSFDFSDTGAGFTDYSYAVVQINGKLFGHKLNEGASKFNDDTKLIGTASFELSPEELAAFTAAQNQVTVMVADTADNVGLLTSEVAGLATNPQTINVWNAVDGLGFDKDSKFYDAKTNSYTLVGGTTQPFYYNGQLVEPKADSTYSLNVNADAEKVVFTADQAGKEVLLTLNTATPKAAFAWQKAHTTEQSFGIDLDTVTTNDPEHVFVYAAVTAGNGVKAFARDYFTGDVYEASVKDGLATFEVKVKNSSRRTVLLGWTEVAGPTFNVVQTTASDKAYLGVDARPSNQPQRYNFASVDELQTDLVQENADPTTLGAPGALPGHALSDLTTRSEPNSEISFDYLEDNNYNWIGAQAIVDGVYDPKAQTFHVTGKVSPDVVQLIMLGNSADEQDPQNHVSFNEDGTFGFEFNIKPTEQRPLAYIYTTKDGQKTRGTVQVILDTVLPTLEFENVANYDFDGENYYVYTNEPNFTIKGTAHDNLDGYRFFFNGDNEFREFHHSGINHGGNPYAPYGFERSFVLNDENGETQHVYTLDVLDVTGNHTTRKFFVYYQPKSEIPAAVDVERNHADAFVEQYPETALLFFDPATQSFQELDPEEFHPDGLYSLVNKYGNVVAVMNVYTVEPEKESDGSEKQEQQDQEQKQQDQEQKQQKQDQHDQNDQGTKEDQAASQDQEKENTGAVFGKDNTTGSGTDQKQVTAGNKQLVPVLQDKAKTPATPATTDLPQTGEAKHQASILGLLALGLASLFTLVGFDRKKETK
ncbi:S8 family serine peptidase [Ligilactobacillus animalis]|uniref:S8 family serine peptidase n=1 Tax=Ligilactobacillus animalis TaxID=1605 RepID=UPI002A751601|nr:S8 family serine peptidase [Ligilactobacillus animalis]MDY2992403.1 S8 family serine peptidase [Ligilactobacillus animalis]